MQQQRDDPSASAAFSAGRSSRARDGAAGKDVHAKSARGRVTAAGRRARASWYDETVTARVPAWTSAVGGHGRRRPHTLLAMCRRRRLRWRPPPRRRAALRRARPCRIPPRGVVVGSRFSEWEHLEPHPQARPARALRVEGEERIAHLHLRPRVTRGMRTGSRWMGEIRDGWARSGMDGRDPGWMGEIRDGWARRGGGGGARRGGASRVESGGMHACRLSPKVSRSGVHSLMNEPFELSRSWSQNWSFW